MDMTTMSPSGNGNAPEGISHRNDKKDAMLCQLGYSFWHALFYQELDHGQDYRIDEESWAGKGVLTSAARIRGATMQWLHAIAHRSRVPCHEPRRMRIEWNTIEDGHDDIGPSLDIRTIETERNVYELTRTEKEFRKC